MQLISVNLGVERPFNNQTGKTGIYKFPSAQPVAVGPLGLQGDAVCDQKNHGGPDQAVYVYGSGDYEWWAQELGRNLEPGAFGENLTISGLESAGFNIGDILQMGAVRLQVSAPRIPCSTFAARMDDPLFVKRFRRAGRPGLYCRVLTPGILQAGEAVTVERYTSPTLSIAAMFEEYYDRTLEAAAIRRQLAAPIAARARAQMEAALAKRLER